MVGAEPDIQLQKLFDFFKHPWSSCCNRTTVFPTNGLVKPPAVMWIHGLSVHQWTIDSCCCAFTKWLLHHSKR